MHVNKKKDRKSYQSKQEVTLETPTLVIEVDESEDDPNGPDYSDEDVEQMFITSDLTTSNFIHFFKQIQIFKIIIGLFQILMEGDLAQDRN